MSISPGFTAAEIREFVHEYQRVPHGQKGVSLAKRRVSYDALGKAIGLVHAMSEEEPARNPTTSDPTNS